MGCGCAKKIKKAGTVKKKVKRIRKKKLPLITIRRKKSK